MSKNNISGSRSLSSTSCNSLTSDFEIIENGIEDLNVNKTSRPSSTATSRTQKAKRIRFFHNGNKFFNGVVIPVAPERYRSFDSLTSELTTILTKNVTLPSGVRNIYSIEGKKVSSLDDLEDGKDYVCGGKGEIFKRIEYSKIDAMKSKRLPNSKITPQLTAIPKIVPPECVRPRIVTIIRNGLKPRKVLRLLLNKRNSSSLEQVLSALTEVAQLDSGAVRKVFTISGHQINSLSQFFENEDVFFVYGNERYSSDDFELEFEESKAIQQHKKAPGLKNGVGPKPKMPKKQQQQMQQQEENELNQHCETLSQLREKYLIIKTIGEGNFANVKICKHRETNVEYALKIIYKAKCKGREDMIENEVKILRKVKHPNIMALIEERDSKKMLYLVCEYVRGGDLFDAIIVVQKFEEDQASLMIRHLASALAYLHNLNIVHRDVKPENLLVEFDGSRVHLLKLGDFGLACEVTGPLYTVCGTPTYVAPEILTESGYGLKIDVWAAGVILYILLCGYPPFVNENNDQEKLFDSILSGQYDFHKKYWQDVTASAKELIQNMLQLDPELRFSAEDVLDHPWLMNNNCSG